ncbi:hypothetical protein BD311DRAFT_822322 [Dichomitus squalens]|uniref:Uncharacterized protein n=1 Tax=Dichomitus squalens TaxID=114155 RepID=A0A4Q9M733_9APHY|nr:hypothetical protein BD311DRAFT_822322 [Dichomitus squalens]
MLAAPSPTRSPARPPSAEHRLSIPDRPPLAVRRHSTLSPLTSSRPLRSSPLAGPSIALAHDGTLKVGAASAPPTPGGGGRHLSPLAELVGAAPEAGAAPGEGEDGRAQKQRRRRTLGAVFSKLSFPSASNSSSTVDERRPAASAGVSQPRTRARSASAHDAPPVPPMPTWAQNTTTVPARASGSSHHAAAPSPSSSRSHTLPRTNPPPASPPSSRPTSPTPSARSNASRRSTIHGHADLRARAGSPPTAARAPPSTSRNPEENWLTQAAPPRFSRLGLKAQGVVLPVSAREARRRSTISTSERGVRSLDALSAPAPAHTRASSSRSSVASGTYGRAQQRPATSPSASASSSRLPSRAASLASASSSRVSVAERDCATPPLTMSSATSASSVSFADPPVVASDELGFLPGGASGVQIQLNDVPVPEEAYYDYVGNGSAKGRGKAKGKERAVAVDVSSVASAGSIGSIVSQASYGSYASGYSGYSASVGSPGTRGSSIVDLAYGHGQGALSRGTGVGARHERAATAPAEVQGGGGAKELKRRSTIGRVWKQVVRSVGGRR